MFFYSSLCFCLLSSQKYFYLVPKSVAVAPPDALFCTCFISPITSNFDTVIKINCLIHFLQNVMALDGSLNVIQKGQTKFCCLLYGKYTPLRENSYLVISGLLLFNMFPFSAFGLQVSRRSCR